MLIIRETQIKTTMRYHLTLAEWLSSKNLQIRNAGEGLERREPSYTVGGNVNWYSHYGKQCEVSSKKWKTELSFVVQLLSHWLCNPMDCSMPGLPVPHYFPEFAQVHVHWVSDAIQPSRLLLLSSPFVFNLFQNQGGSYHFTGKFFQTFKEQIKSILHQFTLGK